MPKSFKEKIKEEFDNKIFDDKFYPDEDSIGFGRQFISDTIDATLSEVEKRLIKAETVEGNVFEIDFKQIIKELRK